jgi:hypothetical protein
MPKKYSKKQKVYKMKGCSKKTIKKKYLGGNVNSGDINLAYPSNNVPTTPNPFLSYTGKGGNSELTSSLEIPLNTNAENKTIPNTGPPSGGYNFINPQGGQRGGSCGCGLPLMTGGCGPLCAVGFMVGGKRHRKQCKCSVCKTKRGQHGGNAGIPYPNGLVGSPWSTSEGDLPGANGIPGDRNYLPHNDYKTDVQLATISTGANPPFSIGGRKSRKQKGGTLSNFIAQDLINLGRQFQFGLGSAYNTLAGYSAPVNPMPWKDQFNNTSNISTIRR